MTQSPQLAAVYQRAWVLQQRTRKLPISQQALLSQALEELQAVLAELQASEEALREQNEALVNTRQAVEAERQRYQSLFEFAPDGYLVTDVHGCIQEANAAIATLLRVSQPFLVGKPLLIFIDQPDHSTFYLTLDQLQQLDTLQDWQVRLRSYQRVPFDAALTVSTVRNAAGQIVSLRWLLRDSTERKQAERLLAHLNAELERQVQERTAQLQQALDFDAGLKRITDKVRDSLDEGQILQAVVQELTLVLGLVCCNTALYDLGLATSTVSYQFTNVECVAASPSVLGQIVSMATLPETYRQLLQGEYFQFCELARRMEHQFTVLACPIADDQGVLGDLWLFKPSQAAFSESEIRLVQQVANQCAIALRQARLYQMSQAQVQELERLHQLKDDFLSTVSHELRTPITNIKMATEMLTISLQPLGVLDDAANAINRYFKILREEEKRELALINDLLDLARLDAGTAPLTLTTIALQSYIPHLAESFSERTQQQQQHLVCHLPDALPDFTTALPYLERILTELLHNACKYTPAGGTISVSAQTTPAALELRVSNTGVEIPATEYERIFDKFYRIPNNDPWKHGGTGLGLALTKKLTECLGGQLHVESGGGQTTFVLTFGSGSAAADGADA